MTETLHILPWADPAVDTLGHDPRSWYAETFWLPAFGPTSLLLMRRFADGFDRNPHGYIAATEVLSTALGLGPRVAAGGPLRKALRRLETFGVTQTNGEGALLVRRKLAPVNRKHIQRLPPTLRSLHHDQAEARLIAPLPEALAERARRGAIRLTLEGESPDCIERVLLTMGATPTAARQIVEWAQRTTSPVNTPRIPTPTERLSRRAPVAMP